MIYFILAVGENNELGLNNNLPWHIKEELAFFKKMTLNQNILFGRKTYESIPKHLEDRKIFVLTKQKNNYDFNNKNVVIINNIDKIISDYYKNVDNDIYICGGLNIYKLFYDFVDVIYLSKIKGKFEADTFMFEIDENIFTKDIFEKHDSFDVFIYKRKVKK
ncbi:dihydrofolate reductase [Spiroplasma endosymbiont of Anurida maritima]|uniref:dihydrofolate reductase n=1 Tax=Spiroplasma endosymbiont of Anurida maritima TaxID=2967972 RepID=UPI0036D22254